MIKSIINTVQVRKMAIEAVEKALEECAFQHQCHNDTQTGWKANAQPELLTIGILFSTASGDIWCMPEIDLSSIHLIPTAHLDRTASRKRMAAMANSKTGIKTTSRKSKKTTKKTTRKKK
jgi:hypothetical protein